MKALPLLAACNERAASTPAQLERPVQVQRVDFTNENPVREFVGVVRARHETDLGFRVAGKIFATLGYPHKTCAMVKLSPEDQHYFSKDYPAVFTPLKGTWGRRGATTVQLEAASHQIMTKAIHAAWRHIAPRRLRKQ